MNHNQRGPWYLLTGVLLGFVIGLAWAWVIQPQEINTSSPHNLQAIQKDQYRVLAAAAFAVTGDLVRAKARLELLGDADPEQAIVKQVNRSAGSMPPEDERALRLLLEALRLQE